MRSLITESRVSRVVARWALLVLTFSGSVTWAGEAAFLEEPTVVAANGEGEIHINFSSEVRYIRHSPEKMGDVLRVFVEVTDPCVAEEIVSQESKWLPATDWYVPFTVTFPELISRPGTGSAVCPATKSVVNVAKSLRVKFAKVTNYKVRMGPGNRSIIIVVPMLKELADSKPAPTVAPQALAQQPAIEQSVSVEPEITKPSEPATPVETATPVELITASRTAMASGDSVNATLLLNRLLNLPPNEYSQEAQEMIGLAREKTGEYDKAKAEYQLYLKLFPDGAGAARVKQRLAALDGMKVEAKVEQPKPKASKGVREVHQNTVTGSVSQYYYTGWTQNRVENDAANDVTKTRTKDQSTLITNLDVTARFRHNEYDTKIVLRDTEARNFFGEIADRNTLSAAYVEHQNKADDYMIRIGRQSGTAQGVMGRFDGVFGRYGLNPQWKIAAVAGVPDNGSHNKVLTNRYFYGAAIEFGPLAEKWSGSVYAIQQVADDLVERRAVGSELRYFNGTTSWFGMLDYDTVYDVVNVAMIQGNWVAFGGYNFNFLLDHRKSPMLYAEPAIQAVPNGRDVDDLRHVLSDNKIYNYVQGLATDSDMAMFGISKQVTERWQLGGDIRYNRTYGSSGYSAPGGNTIDPQTGSGHVFTYTAQAIGTNTLFKDDTSVIMFSYINDPTYNAQNLSFSNSLTLQEKWRIDTSLRYYQEKNNVDTKTWSVSPGLRLNYHWRDNMSFEAEANIERRHSHDPVATTDTDTWRENLFIGYRWDYR